MEHPNNSPGDGHLAVRNMYRIEININVKLRVKLVIYKDHTKTHGQQNIKKNLTMTCSSTIGTEYVVVFPVQKW